MRQNNLMDTMLSQKLSVLSLLLPLTHHSHSNSVRSGTCWKTRAAEKHKAGDGAKDRHGANMRRRRRRPGGLESEFVLAKGRRRLQGRVGKKLKKKKKKNKKGDTVVG